MRWWGRDLGVGIGIGFRFRFRIRFRFKLRVRSNDMQNIQEHGDALFLDKAASFFRKRGLIEGGYI